MKLYEKYKIIDAKETMFRTGDIVTPIGITTNGKIIVIDTGCIMQVISKEYLIPENKEEDYE